MAGRWAKEIALRDAQEAWDAGLKAFVYCQAPASASKTGAQLFTKEVNGILDMGLGSS